MTVQSSSSGTIEAPGEILELFKGGYLSVAEAIDALENVFAGVAQTSNPSHWADRLDAHAEQEGTGYLAKVDADLMRQAANHIRHIEGQLGLRGAAQAEPNLRDALSKGFMTARAYVDYQIIISFEKLGDMQAAHKAIIGACSVSSTTQVPPEGSGDMGIADHPDLQKAYAALSSTDRP